MNRLAYAFAVASLAVAAYFAKAVIAIPLQPWSQWDFCTYYYAVVAHASGLDPFSPGDLSRAAGFTITLPFTYTPVALYALKPLMLLPFTAAFHVYFALKIATVLLLAWTWSRLFAFTKLLGAFLLCVPFLFAGTLLADLRTGNASLFELALLWLAFLAFLAGRRRIFAACVVVAASMKLAPLYFLVLLLVPPVRRSDLAVAAALVAALVVLSVMPDGHLASLFVARMAERIDGASDAALLSLIGRWCGAAQDLSGAPLHRLAPIFWLAASAVVAGGALLKEWPRLRRADPGWSLHFILVASLVYLLVIPRLTLYQFVFALPVVLYFVTAIRWRPWHALVLFTMLGIGNGGYLPYAQVFLKDMWFFSGTVCLACLWFFYVTDPALEPWHPDRKT